MPSIESRSTDISGTHVRAQPVEMPPSSISAPAMPTPHPPYVGRHPLMTSSLPSVFAAPDAALRQFYGPNLPSWRLAQL